MNATFRNSDFCTIPFTWQGGFSLTLNKNDLNDRVHILMFRQWIGIQPQVEANSTFQREFSERNPVSLLQKCQYNVKFVFTNKQICDRGWIWKAPISLPKPNPSFGVNDLRKCSAWGGDRSASVAGDDPPSMSQPWSRHWERLRFALLALSVMDQMALKRLWPQLQLTGCCLIPLCSMCFRNKYLILRSLHPWSALRQYDPCWPLLTPAMQREM